tara:strand:- start:39379 stop:40287 length:909 start_codon:yes stop_codon:yes gene_type:complete
MQEEPSFNAFHFNHLPVLGEEVIESLSKLPQALLRESLIIDATVGGGGHSELILETYSEIKLIGIDQDPNARTFASQRLKRFGSRVKILEMNFAEFSPPEEVSMVLADLGVSSHQLDEPARGFSFRSNGPIDMRMNPQQGINAGELLDKLDEKKLADLIYNYGEEKLSRRIARRIKSDLLEKGPYENTSNLAYAIAGCYPPKLRHGRIHPATKTFQALRIAVNKELEVLDCLLKNAPEWLKNEGLFGVISFHSLEDRRIKKSFLNDERLERVTKKPIRASCEEITNNPRSRSAKFRIATRKA